MADEDDVLFPAKEVIEIDQEFCVITKLSPGKL
jgi:hypothetical protein